MFDLLFRDATLHDGLGSPGRQGDLAVSDGRIVALGEVAGDAPAREVIDARGLCLMPGIIDNHTHYDAQITWDPYLAQSTTMGVTSAIIGNCGFTIAPCRPQSRDLVVKNLTQVEGMSLASLQEGIRWGFETFPQYLDQIEAQGSAPNLAAFVGHSTLRTYVMGGEASDRVATDAEIAVMQQLVGEAMDAGALGLASTTSTSHSAFDGRPMPSRLADEREFAALLAPLAQRGRGAFMLTKSPQTTVAWLESLAAGCGRPFLVAALLHSPLAPEMVFDDLRAIGEARLRGRRMRGAVAATPLVFDFSFQSPYPLEPLATWKPVFGLRDEALIARMRDPAFRAALREELAVPSRRLFSGDFEQVQVLETASSANARFEYRTVADIARELRRDPLDVMFDLAIEEKLQTLFSVNALNYDEPAVGRLLADPVSLVSLSDAGAHLSFLDESGFGLHLLGYWARDRGVLTVPQAVARLTSEQAEFFGIPERGVLKVGYAADLLLFDAARVGRGEKSRASDLPAGATRVVTKPRGVAGVWVNGMMVADARGVRPQALPGRLLRNCATG